MPSKPRRFAEGTEVSADKSRAEIERLLIRHGANGFMSAWGDEGGKQVSFIQFTLLGRMLRYRVVRPHASHPDYQKATNPIRAAEREFWRRWRALLLILKAKLEMVASGDVEFDHEFMADIMLPDGKTVWYSMMPQIEKAYLTRNIPPQQGPGSA